VITPVQHRVDLKFYGFLIGELNAPSAQLDATIRASRFFSITPSYLYYSVPANGLNELANISRGFTHRFEEHQFRIDGTVMFPIHKFEISERNMYVRRFLPNNDSNRYRNRIAVGRRSSNALAPQGSVWCYSVHWPRFFAKKFCVTTLPS
jgi:hypothetical protein